MIKILALVFLVGAFAASATAAKSRQRRGFQESTCYGVDAKADRPSPDWGMQWDDYNYDGGGGIWLTRDIVRSGTLAYVGDPKDATPMEWAQDCHAQVCRDVAMDNQALWGTAAVKQTKAFCALDENRGDYLQNCGDSCTSTYKQCQGFPDKFIEAWDSKKHALYGVQGDGDSDCRVYGENMEFPHQAAGKSTGKADDQEVLSSEQDDDGYVDQWACTASCGGMVFEAVKGSTKIYVDDVIKADIASGTIAVGHEMRLSAGTGKEETVVITGVGPITFTPALEFDHSLLPTFLVDLSFAVPIHIPSSSPTTSPSVSPTTSPTQAAVFPTLKELIRELVVDSVRVGQVDGTILDLDCATGSMQANIDKLTEALYNAIIAGGAKIEDIISISTSPTCDIPTPQAGFCAAGVLSPNEAFCCDAGCGVCGGPGCGQRPGGGISCCTSNIKKSKAVCALATDVGCAVPAMVGGTSRQRRQADVFTFATEVIFARSAANAIVEALVVAATTNNLDYSKVVFVGLDGEPVAYEVKTTQGESAKVTVAVLSDPNTNLLDLVSASDPVATPPAKMVEKGKKAKHGEEGHMGKAKKSKADKSSKKAQTTKKEGDGKKGKKGKSAKKAKEGKEPKDSKQGKKGKKGKRGKGDAAGLMATAGGKVTQNKIAFGSVAAVCILAVAAAFFATKQQRQPAQTTIVVLDETSPILPAPMLV